MGDPLSVAASVTGLVSLGIQVTQSLVDLYTAYRSRDDDIENTARNLGNLLTIFQSLENALEQRKFRADEQSLIEQIERSIGDCEEVIHELEEELQKFKKSAAQWFTAALKTAGHRVAYPFRRSSLQSLDEKVQDITQNISLAQQVLQLNDSGHIRSDVEDIKALLALVRSSQISTNLQTWLGAPDATINHNDACAKRHPSTGMWLVRGSTFEKWLTEANSFLWINGFAGGGKSVLCSTAIQHAFRHRRSNSRVGIAFFYVSFNDISKQDASGMLRAFLFQLSGQLNSENSDLIRLHANYNTGTPPLPALLATLEDVVRKFQDVYLVVDALDESPQHTAREYLLEVLTDLHCWKFDGLHVLVTSRDIPDIREAIEPWSQIISMKNEGVDKDIAEFIKGHLEKSPALRKWAAHHELIRDALTSRAEGVFRWVECQFKSLAQCPRSEASLKARLKSLPRSLDETYERILLSIDKDCIEDAKRILTLLCFSLRPMTITEVIEGVAVELGQDPKLNLEHRLHDENDLFQICPGLIDISDPLDIDNYPGLSDDESLEFSAQEQTLRIAHFSVREYLESPRILQQEAAAFSIQIMSANDELARICLASLLDPVLSDDFMTTRTMFSERPLLKYAAKYWYRHHEIGKDRSIQTEPLLIRLFQKRTIHLRNWTKLYNPHFDQDVALPGDGVNEESASPIYYACLLGLTSIVSHILKVEDYGGPLAKPVQDSVSTDSFGSVNLLNSCSGYLGSALCAASYNGQTEVMQILLDKGADINYCLEDAEHYNALEAAISGQRIEVVRLLLEKGADVNCQGGAYGNALLTASKDNSIEIVELLLSKGADINAQGRFHGNALQVASYNGRIEVMEMLLLKGADINAHCGYHDTALQAASLAGLVDAVKLLLDRGADINAQGGHYGNALQAASWIGSVDAVQLLLDRGADINAQGGHYGNALQAACWRRSMTIVRCLLDRGANVNAKGGRYGSALRAALEFGLKDIVQLLLDRGAEPLEDDAERISEMMRTG